MYGLHVNLRVADHQPVLYTRFHWPDAVSHVVVMLQHQIEHGQTEVAARPCDLEDICPTQGGGIGRRAHAACRRLIQLASPATALPTFSYLQELPICYPR